MWDASDDVAEIKRLLQNNRLVTLVGTGGAGKTRCAIQAGAELLDGFGDGVWLVGSRADFRRRRWLAAEIARAPRRARAPQSAAARHAARVYRSAGSLLLILDNCEHVIDEARGVVAAILRACPDVRILATSRESLNIARRTESFACRRFRCRLRAKLRAAQSDACRTVRWRSSPIARRLRTPALRLTDENAPHVAEICGRLDGIPLAIELAAARVKVLSPQAARAETRRALSRADRRRPERAAAPADDARPRSIGATTCSRTRSARSFGGFRVFAGGFTLESASAVCGDDAVDEIAVLDLLSSLVDKSLVHAESGGGATRYRLLESTREYAREKLVELGEYPAVARAHAQAFVAFAEQLERYVGEYSGSRMVRTSRARVRELYGQRWNGR